jgi:hypothetical protein
MIAQNDRINLTVAGQSTNLAEQSKLLDGNIQYGRVIVIIVIRTRTNQYRISQARGTCTTDQQR